MQPNPAAPPKTACGCSPPGPPASTRTSRTPLPWTRLGIRPNTPTTRGGTPVGRDALSRRLSPTTSRRGPSAAGPQQGDVRGRSRLSVSSLEGAHVTLDDLARLVAAPPIDCRPELRWWLAEGLHTDQTLRYEIDTAHGLGFGGMEFLAMDEAAVDHSRYGWGSEEWV